MKKEIKVVSIVLVALIVFLSGFGLGASKGINFNINGEVNLNGGAASAGPATPAPAPTEATPAPAPAPAPAPTEATTAAPAAGGDTTTAAPEATTAAPSASGVPSTPEEVVAKYNEVVNAAKNEQKMSIHKVEDIQVNLTDCSIKAATSLLNPIISGLVKPADVVFDIENGVNAADGDRTPNNYIFPCGRPAEVTVAGVSTATAAANSDGGYTITLKFKAEEATFDGTTSTEPTGHKGGMDPLNLGTLDISPATISSAKMTYSGADATATVNADGKLTQLKVYLPMEGGGEGGISFFNVTLALDGFMDTTFDITY